jgi:hypothetical protein
MGYVVIVSDQDSVAKTLDGKKLALLYIDHGVSEICRKMRSKMGQFSCH